MGSSDDVHEQEDNVTDPPQVDDSTEQHDFASAASPGSDGSHTTLKGVAPEEGSSVSSTQSLKSRASVQSFRPPLPPRPDTLNLLNERPAASAGLKLPRPDLLSRATTGVSYTDINYHSGQDGSAETYASTRPHTPTGQLSRAQSKANLHSGGKGSDAGDSASIASAMPSSDAGGDIASLMGDTMSHEQNSAWKILSSDTEKPDPFEVSPAEDEREAREFDREFEEIGDIDPDGENEEALLNIWKSKWKHFLILSAAGKPIYNRHGDNSLISSYIGIIQTIISFYQEGEDPLRSFSAGEAKFVILSEGSLHLVAISKLGESDAQLRAQLDALYMQILSTLTLPTLTNIFSKRPSSDLSRPLQGTESLLSALADSFTRGSPSTLLSALECLKLRKSHRQVINNTLLKTKTETLLYGLIVAGGRLVSVVRPKRHSLHPGDLQLIFNMLFEVQGIKAGEGENWIPLCLPGFNNKGYLYMYVSFLDLTKDDGDHRTQADYVPKKEDQVAVLLISANKESFYELRKMRDDVVEVSHFYLVAVGML